VFRVYLNAEQSRRPRNLDIQLSASWTTHYLQRRYERDIHSVCLAISTGKQRVDHMDRDPKSNDTPRRRLTSTVDLVHLRYAVAAADHGSFRRAAEILLLPQTKLSRCVRQLEERIGMIIFDRSSGGVRATRAGRHFLRTARSILEQMDTLMASAHSAGRGELGQLAIGFYTSLSAGNLRAILIEYAKRFPQVEISMIEGSRTRLTTAIRNGAIDVAIVTGERSLLDSETMPLWSERILVVLPETHRLADGDTVFWTDLNDETLLIRRHDPGPEMQDLLLAKLVSPGDRPKALFHDTSLENIKSLVGAGFGVSLVTESDVGTSQSGLVHRELRDGTGPSRVGYSAHWSADNDNPVLASFLKILRERYPPAV
jgi:DNA-binding transcriptional LysR family regulator